MARRAIASASLMMPGARMSQGVRCDPGSTLLFISGLTAYDAEGRPVAPGDVAVQARAILRAIAEICENAGGSVTDVVMLTVYMRDVTKVAEVGEVRAEFFTAEPLPASTVVEVSRLVSEHRLIEIDAVAAISVPGH